MSLVLFQSEYPQTTSLYPRNICGLGYSRAYYNINHIRRFSFIFWVNRMTRPHS